MARLLVWVGVVMVGAWLGWQVVRALRLLFLYSGAWP